MQPLWCLRWTPSGLSRTGDRMHVYPERLWSREGRPQSCGMFHCTSGHAMTSRWVLVCTETTIDLPQCGQTASSAAALTEKRSCVTRWGLPARNILLRNLITAGRGDVAMRSARRCAHCAVSGWRVLYHHNINLNDKTQWLRDKHASGLSHSRILQVNLMHENTAGHLQYFVTFLLRSHIVAIFRLFIFHPGLQQSNLIQLTIKKLWEDSIFSLLFTASCKKWSVLAFC